MLAMLAGFISHCLQSDTPPVTSVVMTTWLFVCRQLYKTGVGLVAMEKYKIYSNIINRLQKVFTCIHLSNVSEDMRQQMGIEEVRGQLGGCGFQLGRELVDNLLSVAWSPRGVALLESSRQLRLCVEYMWQRMRQGQRVRHRSCLHHLHLCAAILIMYVYICMYMYMYILHVCMYNVCSMYIHFVCSM